MFRWDASPCQQAGCLWLSGMPSPLPSLQVRHLIHAINEATSKIPGGCWCWCLQRLLHVLQPVAVFARPARRHQAACLWSPRRPTAHTQHVRRMRTRWAPPFPCRPEAQAGMTTSAPVWRHSSGMEWCSSASSGKQACVTIRRMRGELQACLGRTRYALAEADMPPSAASGAHSWETSLGVACMGNSCLS